ncbi:MAG TPA: hypothetical protein VMH33_05475 [Solirubrobacterales bacterium]|nr:hypothetical protein [Solirubrobacterales bacterium]
MNFNEAAVFKWVLIFAAAGASVYLLALVAGELVGAIWAFLLALVGCAYGIRWTRDWWRRLKRPGD